MMNNWISEIRLSDGNGDWQDSIELPDDNGDWQNCISLPDDGSEDGKKNNEYKEDVEGFRRRRIM